MRDLSLPPAPPLVMHTNGGQPVAVPTPQARPTDKDGGPLEVLSTCRWCGGMHPTACPFIKIAEWHPTGQLARIVLKERVDLEKAILYPFEDDPTQVDALRRALGAIAEAQTLKGAREIAAGLLQLLEGEQA